tara:strand:+ start:6663 stop:7052 length:390 start_codon:yes stop_codon:yes gene_type:complete
LTDWLRLQDKSGKPDQLSSLHLAWIGDAVWEMHNRLKYINSPAKSKDLHISTVKDVNASAQSQILKKLEPFLTLEEKVIIKRARNTNKRVPRNSDPATYSMATSFESLVGWLFLKNPQRLADLFDLLEN